MSADDRAAAAQPAPADPPAAVTVVVPAYQAEADLAIALASLRAQTRGDFEAVVVDDGSTDRTAAIATAHAAQDPRVRLIQMPENRGRAAARNAGVAAGRAPLVAFLDADDAYHPRFLEATVGGLATRPDLDGLKVMPLIHGLALDPVRLRAVARSAVVTLVLRRDTFIRIGGFSEDPAFRATSYGGEDVALQVALDEIGAAIGWIEVPLYLVRAAPGDHLHRFVARTRVDDGRLVHLEGPDDAETALLAAAIDRIRAQMRRVKTG